MKNKKKYMILIHKSLTGEISKQENNQLQEWLRNPENEMIYNDIKMVWENTDQKLYSNLEPEHDVDILTLQARLDEAKRQNNQIRSYNKKVKYQYYAIAGLFLIIGLLSLLVLSTPNHSIETTSFYANKNFEAFLSDSSKVILNKESHISFTNSHNQRELTLTGEAFFDVYKDIDKPFIVYAGNISLKVLGTSFLVKAYANEPLEVILISGNVAVYYKDQTIELNETNNKLTIDKEARLTTNNDPNYDSWMTGTFHFENTSLSTILIQLEKHFNVSFNIENENLLNCRFTGSFKNVKDIETVLLVLSKSIDFKYEPIKNVYKINGKGCPK